jgi:hypothetical protein
MSMHSHWQVIDSLGTAQLWMRSTTIFENGLMFSEQPV